MFVYVGREGYLVEMARRELCSRSIKAAKQRRVKKKVGGGGRGYLVEMALRQLHSEAKQ